MKIIVTGGAGFIGSNLVRHLVGQGHHVVNIDKLTYAGNLASLVGIENKPNYRFAKADIADHATIKSIVNSFAPDAIMHLAAESHVDRSIDGPREFIQTNVIGTFNLLECALSHWRSLSKDDKEMFRFLHVSTDEVYGSLGHEGYFSEDTRYDPHSPYSASKAASDHLVRAWGSTYGLPVLVTNCSNNYGPYQFPEKLLPVVILKCLRKEAIPVYGKGDNVRDWLYVEDHCEALLEVLLKGTPGETYNIGGSNEMQNIDIVRMVCNLVDEMRPNSNLESGPSTELITFVTDRPGHDKRYAIDATKLRDTLGWQPKQDRVTGLRKTVRWYIENASWWQSILNGSYRLERQGLDLVSI
jgi:dTDP-glucose 4,6-dehydratase